MCSACEEAGAPPANAARQGAAVPLRQAACHSAAQAGSADATCAALGNAPEPARSTIPDSKLFSAAMWRTLT